MAEQNPTANSNPQASAQNGRQVSLQRIYLKDCSLEVPQAPQVFTRQWNPKVDVQVGTSIDALSPQDFQVMLAVTVTAKLGDEVGFLAEVHQAGVFQLSGFGSEAEVQGVLGGYCPNVVFPFAREAIASLIQRAGFPPVLLQPINFEGLYLEHLARTRGQAAAAPAGSGIVLQ